MKPAAFALLALLPFAGLANASSYTLEVNGLACQHCADQLEKQLQTLNGVQSVQFDLAAKKVEVDLAEGQELKEEELRSAVTESGFSLVSVEKSVAASEQ